MECSFSNRPSKICSKDFAILFGLTWYLDQNSISICVYFWNFRVFPLIYCLNIVPKYMSLVITVLYVLISDSVSFKNFFFFFNVVLLFCFRFSAFHMNFKSANFFPIVCWNFDRYYFNSVLIYRKWKISTHPKTFYIFPFI